jgi:hypothetical protein
MKIECLSGSWPVQVGLTGPVVQPLGRLSPGDHAPATPGNTDIPDPSRVKYVALAKSNVMGPTTLLGNLAAAAGLAGRRGLGANRATGRA